LLDFIDVFSVPESSKPAQNGASAPFKPFCADNGTEKTNKISEEF